MAAPLNCWLMPKRFWHRQLPAHHRFPGRPAVAMSRICGSGISGVTALVEVAVAVYGPLYGLKPTQNRAAVKRCSACALVAKALNRRKRLPITERQVQRIYEDGWKEIAAKLSERIHLQ